MKAIETNVRRAHPTRSGRFRLFTDASSAACGAVLTQERTVNGDTVFVPIAFESSLNSTTEQKYSPTELEAMAVVKALRKFRCFLHGTREFDIVTDHRALEFVTGDPNKSGRLARWHSSLAEYNYSIIHRPGNEMAFVDSLSRGPFAENARAHSQDALARPHDLTGKQRVLFSTNPAIGAISVGDARRVDPARMAAAQRADALCSTIHARIDGAVAALPGKDLAKFASGLSFRRRADNVIVAEAASGAQRVLVPLQLRASVMEVVHDDAGHAGIAPTAAAAARSFVWPQMHRDIAHWVQSCSLCKARHATTRGEHARYGVLPQARRTGDVWFMDTIHAVQKESGRSVYVLSAVDAHTRWAETSVLTSTRAASCHDAFLESVTRRYGTPLAIVVDDGPEFKGDFRRRCETAGIDVHVTTAGTRSSLRKHYGISPVERFHRVLWDRLAFAAPTQVADWAPIVSAATAAYNCATGSVAKTSPYEEVFGESPRNAIDAMYRLPTDAGELLQRVHDAADARAAAATARSTNDAGSSKTYNVGDAVWFRADPPTSRKEGNRNVSISDKLLFRFAPGTIETVSGHSPIAYGVRNNDTNRLVSRTVHDLHDRHSRTALLDEWHCNPFSPDHCDPGSGAAAPHATRVLPPPTVAHTRNAPQVGWTILIMRSFAMDATLAEPLPIAVAARITHWNRNTRRATVSWLPNCDGVSDPHAPRQIRLPADKFLGSCTNSDCSSDAGEWARYTGPDLHGGPLLQSIVAQQPRRQHDGAMISMFRCRFSGLGPNADVWRSRADCVQEHPGNGETLLARFRDTCVAVP